MHEPIATTPQPVEPVPAAPRPVLPVLSYEKPGIYRYKSDLPPPGLAAEVFWAACYCAGWLLGLIYRPRPAPRLYTSKPLKR
jgi:hypothetical protein